MCRFFVAISALHHACYAVVDIGCHKNIKPVFVLAEDVISGPSHKDAVAFGCGF